uniref:Uncharacterized protein n=1 Tax=Arion vulgaris TaxID=1028688 RepID=A0A0B7A420_9EUPU
MASQEILSVALIVALSSNIVLLLILILKSSNVPLFNESPAKLEQTTHGVSSRSEGLVSDNILRQINSDGEDTQLEFADASQSKIVTSAFRPDFKEKTSNNRLILSLLKAQLMQSGKSGWQDTKLDYPDFSRSSHGVDDFKGQFPSTLEHLDQQYNNDFNGRDHSPRPFFEDIDLSAQGLNKEASENATKTLRKTDHVLEEGTNYSNHNDPPERQSPSRIRHLPLQLANVPVKRIKKEAVAPSSATISGGKWGHRVHEIFSTFTDGELGKFDTAVYDILIPALIHFETMIIREFESIHTSIISHDLRLEKLENSVLIIIKGNNREPQSDTTDNKSVPDSPSRISDKKDGIMSTENNSHVIELSFELDGSGDAEWSSTPTPTTHRTETIQNAAFVDMYHIFGTLEQKVMSLENYNVMSDSELTRVRSEVVKMDDKVTELDRQQRNLQIRTAMHTQKITELEVYMSKSELSIHTVLDSYGRINSRLDTFRDKLTEFKNDLQAVSIQFGRHDQISNELRAADSYKAHDIQEMRKSVFGIEGRLSGLYRVLDNNLDTVRSDLRAMLDRVCRNNKLAC